MADDLTRNDNYIGFIVSSFLLGAFIGAVPASFVADRFSRRTGLVAAAAIFIMGGIMQAACQNKETMLAGRFFAGVGVGAMGCLVPCKLPYRRRKHGLIE
jgi:MFS family permease